MDGMERWVQETFAPIVLTCTTPEVERIAQKNNLSFADLLNGFSMLANVDTPIRSVTHSFTLAQFNYRFLPATQCGVLAVADSMALLNQVVMRHPPPSSASVIDLDMPLIKSVEDVPVFLRAIGANNNTEPLPWYREFKRIFMDTFRCEEYSMMTHPVALLLVVSSTDGNPRHCFEQLGAAQNLPTAFQQGLYDVNIPKYYLILHDVVETEGTSIDPDAILHNLNVPAHSGAVLRINSLPIEAAAGDHSNVWTTHPFVRPPLFSDVNAGNYPYLTDHIGGLQSLEDLGRLQAFAQDFGLRFVIPALESRIFQLNEIVSAMKKGVKNVFKSWLRKPKELTTRSQTGATSSQSSVMYRCDSIEAQTRLLADTAFIIRDYDLALQSYRLARDDYKSDKSMFHCANANEMIALCLLLTKGSPMQMTNALEAATSTYYKITNATTCRLAVRAALIAGEIYNTLSHSGLFTDYMDSASAALIRGSTMEQGICSAVLMERAAVCDLQARSPKFRKFGFRMVMAGHVYDSLGHSAHSARCYSLARAVYDCSGWFQVEDHINFTLAQQSNRLHDPMASINLFLKLIGTGRNSASQQEALLYEFGMIVREFLTGGGPGTDGGARRNGGVAVKNLGSEPMSKRILVVRDLCMPELDDKSTVVFAPVNATGINREIDGNSADLDAWKELEQILDKQNQIHRHAMTTLEVDAGKDGANIRQNVWLAPVKMTNASYRNKRTGQVKKPDQYALGEKIYVEFEMKNALSCAVDVENIHLYGKFEPKDSSIDNFDVPESSDPAQDRIAVEHVNLQLLPVSEERVRLAVCPKIPGTLRILGIRWSICGGDVHGEHAFNIPGPLLQDTRANKEARARAPNMSLIADVVGTMPWLGVQVQQVSSDVFVGEIIRLNVSLINAGSAELDGLQLCCSDLTLCALSEDVGDGRLAGFVGSSGQVIDLSHIRLRPGESCAIVLWARGARPGKQQARLLFKYKRRSESGSSEELLDRASVVSRFVKVKIDLKLMPCVEVSYAIEPSYAVSGEYFLGLTTSNRRQDVAATGAASSLLNNSAIQLNRVTCVSKHWQILPFGGHTQPTTPGALRESTVLRMQESSTTYFRIVPKETVGSDQSCIELNTHGIDKINVDELPVEQILCLDYAALCVRLAEQAVAEQNAEGEKAGGIRSIQSVRRENKAMRSDQQGGDVVSSDQVPKRNVPQPTTPEALLQELDVDAHLILLWSTPKPSSTIAVGQANLTSIRVRSPLKVNNACPLTIALDYDDSISLQPVSSVLSIPSLALAELDVRMTIRNDSTLGSSPIDFTLEILQSEEVKPSSSVARHHQAGIVLTQAPSPHFFWTGLTRKTVSRFAPNDAVVIQLKACFMAAGVYDLNRFRFTISRSGSMDGTTRTPPPGAVFVFPVEYLVSVQPSPPDATRAA